MLEVKVVGTYLCSKAAAIQMIEQSSGGRIVNISSTAGKRGNARMAAYNASNFAVDGFTQALAKELAEHEITANCVCPGMTETARLDPVGRGDEWMRRAAQVPMGRPATDMESGRTDRFLVQPPAPVTSRDRQSTLTAEQSPNGEHGLIGHLSQEIFTQPPIVPPGLG